MTMTSERPVKEFMDVKIGLLMVTPDNPRVVNEKSPDFLELLASIKSEGVQQPVDIRIHPMHPKKFDLRTGARRLRAAKKAGLKTMPCVFWHDMTDEQAFERTFIENYGRKDLTPAEQGRAVATLMTKWKGDVKHVAKLLGQTDAWVRTRAKLQDLCAKFRAAICDPHSDVFFMTVPMLEWIARYPTNVQEHIIEEAGMWNFRNTAFKDLAKWLDDHYAHLITAAPWKMGDEDLVRSATSCLKCKKRTGAKPDLWGMLPAESMTKTDKCLDGECWRAKTLAFLPGLIAETRKEHSNLVLIGSEGCDWSDVQHLEEELKKQIVAPHGYDSSRKGVEGAVPGLILVGPKTGKIKWVRLHQAFTEDGRSTGTAKRAKGVPAPLSERRLGLARRRNIHVLSEMMKAVITVKTPTHKWVQRFATYFGCNQSADAYKPKWKDYLDWCTKKDPNRALDVALWEQTRGNITDRLRYQGTHSPVTKMIEFATGLADVLGIAITPMHQAAAEAIPEPKGWANLTPDGYPKKGPAKPKKKAAGATQAAPKKPKKAKSTKGTKKAKKATKAKKGA